MDNANRLDSIENIAATIAHEVKNPLSLVKANIELLESADTERLFSKNYNVIKNQLNLINEMIMNFLQLTEEVKEEFDIVYLYDVACSVLENYKVSLSSKVDFYIVCPDKNISILGLKKCISSLILNILKNSVEAISSKKGTINIKILNTDQEAIISISDNGDGIPEEKISTLGDSFFTTKENGNGLGVAICKKIVSQHNGTITYKNNPDCGCTVTLTFPLYC
ncbi:MAG: HAMP domain-containing histidine kinase [Clostridiales bacterium]|nr:HAMP domain-containing histidine kinase [Clostridiales bacterium]